MNSFNHNKRSISITKVKRISYSLQKQKIIIKLLSFVLFLNVIQCYKLPPPPPPLPSSSSSYQDWTDDDNNMNRPSSLSSSTSASTASSASSAVNYKEALPIHYSFEKDQEQKKDQQSIIQDDDKDNNNIKEDDDGDINDTITFSTKVILYNKYTSKLSSRMYLSIYTSIIGSIISIFLTKSCSFLPRKITFSTIISFYIICTILPPKYTNVYITFVQSLGIIFHQSIKQYNIQIRKNERYKTLPYILALLQLKKDKPVNIDYKDNEKVGSMICIFFLGALFGSTIPYLPTSVSGTTTAFFFLYFCTNQNSIRGDLFRLISIRLYTFFITIIVTLWKDMDMTKTIKNVFQHVLQLCFIVDRKHKVYDKFIALCNFIYYNMIMKIWNSASSSNNNKDGDDVGDDRIRRARVDDNRKEDADDRRRRYPDRDDDDGRRSREQDYNDNNRRQDYERSNKNPNNDRYDSGDGRSYNYPPERRRREDDDEYYNQNNKRRISRDEEEDRKNKENSNYDDDGKKKKSSFWNVLSKK